MSGGGETERGGEEENIPVMKGGRREGWRGDEEEMEKKGERRLRRRRGEKRDDWRKGRLGSDLTWG